MELGEIEAVLCDVFGFSIEDARSHLEAVDIISTVNGFITIRNHWIDELYVKPESRGHGIGIQLMKSAIQQGGKRLKCRSELREYYEQLGFVVQFTAEEGEHCYMAIP